MDTQIINDIKIDVPEGMEAYLEDNTIKFRAIKKKLTYDDIAKELFLNKDTYYLYSSPHEAEYVSYAKIGNIDFVNFPCNCSTHKQGQKLLAIGKLINVAKYLNGDWQPDWKNNKEYKYYFCMSDNEIQIDYMCCRYSDIVYFKSKELAQQAIEILGEETIKLALCTDW